MRGETDLEGAGEEEEHYKKIVCAKKPLKIKIKGGGAWEEKKEEDRVERE